MQEGHPLVLRCNVKANVDDSAIVFRWIFQPNTKERGEVVSTDRIYIIEKAALENRGIYTCEAIGIKNSVSKGISVNVRERRAERWYMDPQVLATRKPVMDDKLRTYYTETLLKIFGGLMIIIVSLAIGFIVYVRTRQEPEDVGKYIAILFGISLLFNVCHNTNIN